MKNRKLIWAIDCVSRSSGVIENMQGFFDKQKARRTDRQTSLKLIVCSLHGWVIVKQLFSCAFFYIADSKLQFVSGDVAFLHGKLRMTSILRH